MDYPEDQIVEFRDGRKLVPAHVAQMLSGIATHRFTYDEAIRESDRQRLNEHVRRAQEELLREHFARSS